MWRCPLFKKELNDIDVTFLCGLVQWRRAEVSHRVDFSTAFD